MALTRKQEAWREAGRHYPGAVVNKRIRIADPMGQDVKFVYRPAQQVVSDIKREIHQMGIPLRLWVGKWRRAGITAEESAEDYVYCRSVDNARVGVIAHLEERAAEILNNYRAYDKSIATFYPAMDIEKSKDNIFGIKFKETNGQALIGTAKNPIKIRGDGIQRLQNSEAAHFFGQFRKVMKEVCPVVPPSRGSQIVNESTGSLLGSAPHQHWIDSVDWTDFLAGKRRNKNEFIKIFLNWTKFPTEAVPFDDDRHKDEILSLIIEHEPRLAELNKYYKLTPEMMHSSWIKFHLQSDNDFQYFCREFPYDEAMMWAAGGDSYFGVSEITKAKPQHPLAIYVIEDDHLGQLFTDPGSLRRVDNVEDYGPRPYVKLWAPPVKGHRYAIGADCSQGVDNGDYGAGYVGNIHTTEMMASYHGRLHAQEAACVLASLGRIYNMALLAPETNPQGGGAETMNLLQRLGYYNIYRWRVRDHKDGLRTNNALGWYTNPRSRPLMLGSMRRNFLDFINGKRPDPGSFRDTALLREMHTFSMNAETGQPEANANCFDDRVFAKAILDQVCSDEVYCTDKDLLFMQNRVQPIREPIDQNDLIIKARDPNKVIGDLLGPKSNFLRNKFEL